MKISIFFRTFDYCRNMLGRLLPLDLKTLRFLTCTTEVQISGENRKPYQASCNNRQVRNRYDVFSLAVLILQSVVGTVTLKMVYKTGSRKVDADLATNTRSEATHSPVRTETIYCDRPDGRWKEKGFIKVSPLISLFFNMGGLGGNPLFHFTLSVPSPQEAGFDYRFIN